MLGFKVSDMPMDSKLKFLLDLGQLLEDKKVRKDKLQN